MGLLSYSLTLSLFFLFFFRSFFLSFLCFSFFLCLFSAFALLPFSFAIGDMRNEVRLRLEFHFLRHLTEGRKINARVLVTSAEKREAQNWPVFFSCFWCRREYLFF